MATTAELQILLTAKDAASKEIDGLGKSLGALGGVGKVAAVGLAGLATVGVGLAAGIGKSISAAADFESAMSAVGAVSGATSNELAALSAKALALGQDSTLAGIGATDAAQAMQELAAGGVSTQDILEGAAQGALLLASAGGIAVPRAAEIATNALNQFGLSGKDAGHVADLLAGAANASSADVSDLGESLKYVGPIAKSMGISIDETVATLAEFGAQGIKGSQAGTALRSILASLAKPSDQASAAMKSLGLSFFDASGKMKSIGGISEELKTKLGGLTDQQRANTLVTLFGNEALSAATVLYGEGAGGLKKYFDQVTVAGSAAEVGAKRNDNLKGSIEQLKSSLETAAITLGQAFLPAVRGIVNHLTDAVNAAVPFIQHYGPMLAAALQKGIGAVVGFGTAVAGGVGAVVDALGKLASGQITLAQFIGGMEIFVTTIRDKLGQLAKDAAPYIGQFFQAIASFIATYAPQIAAQFQLWAASFVNWITDTAIPFVLPKLEAFGQAVLGWITGTAVPALQAAALQLAAALGNWITETAIPFLQTNLPIWGQALWGWITDTAVPAVVAAVQGLATAMSEWVTTTAIPFLQTNLPLWLTALGDWITGTAVPAVVAFLTPLAQQFADWVKESVPPLLAQLGKWYLALEGWILGTAVPAIIQTQLNMAHAFADWVGDSAIPYLQAELPKWLVALGNWILGTALPAAKTALLAVGEAFGDWVAEKAIPWLTQELPKWQLALVEWILGTALPAALEALLTLALTFGDFITQKAVPYLLEKIPEWLTAMLDWFTGTAIPDIKAGLLILGQEFGDFITNKAVPWLLTQIPLWLDAITTYITGTAIPAVEGVATDLGKHLVDFFMTEAEKLKTRASAEMAKVPGAIKDGLGDLSGLLYGAGRSLVQGFIDGINSLINSIPSIPLPNIPSLPGRASGGPIAAGRVYMVGEHGPELFVSSQAGHIVPHGPSLARRGGGASDEGGAVIHNYYISGNTLLTKDSATQNAVSGIVTAAQRRTIGYSI